MIGISFAISFTANLTAMIFPGAYAALFTNDRELIGLVSKVMPVFLFGMLFFGLQNGIQPTFLALGQAKISLFIAMFRKVILLVPLALVLPVLWSDGDLLCGTHIRYYFCGNSGNTVLYKYKENSVERISGKNPMRE